MDEYILMCREAEEIQRLWKPRIGDVIAPGDSGKLIIGVREEENTILLQEWGDKNYWVNDYDVDDPVVWLPRQEDLQDLCCINGELQRITDYGITDYVDTFYEFVRNQHKEVTEYNNSGGKLWLLFTMQNNYSKTWDSEAKMWVSL